MAGIHQCWKCGYRFESKPELLDHEEVCDGNAPSNVPLCRDCPDHEACMQGYPCDMVRAVAKTREELK